MDTLLSLLGHLSTGSIQQVAGLVTTIIGLLRALGVPGAFIVGPVIAFYLLFSFVYFQYCAVIKLKSVWPKLHIVIKVLVAWVAVLALFEDILVNLLVGPILLVDLIVAVPMLVSYTIGWYLGYLALGVLGALAISLGVSILKPTGRYFLFTDRLHYWHENDGPGLMWWRHLCSTWLCEKGLNPIEAEHC